MATAARTSPGTREPETDLQSVNGGLEITRRLSDKILAAFNHAYGIGEVEVAQALRRALALTEEERPAVERRGSYSPVAHAELWVAFVEARETYKTVMARPGARPAEMDAALDRMKDAYRAWTEA